MYGYEYGDQEEDAQEYYYPPQPPPNRAAGGKEALVLAVVIAFVAWLVFGGLPSSDSESAPPESAAPAPPAADIPVEEVVPAGMKQCNTNWNPGSNKACRLAKNYAGKRITDPVQLGCLDILWINESNWDAWADNPKSTALGIPQGLTGLHGPIYKVGEWRKQVDWGLAYIAQKYQDACKALAFWRRTDPRPHSGHWY